MRLKSILKLGMVIVLLAMLVSTVVAAVNDSQYQLLKPGMGSKWLNEVGIDVTDTLDWLIGGLVAALIIAFVVFSIIGGIKIFGNSGDMGSPEKKSSGHNILISILGGLLLVVLVIRVGLVFFGWF